MARVAPTCRRCQGKPTWGRMATIVVLEHEDGSVRMIQGFEPGEAFDPCSWAHSAAEFGARAIERALDGMLLRSDAPSSEDTDEPAPCPTPGLAAGHG